MGQRGELFSSRANREKRTYFFNVKENRSGDLFLNIVESRKRESADAVARPGFRTPLLDGLRGGSGARSSPPSNRRWITHGGTFSGPAPEVRRRARVIRPPPRGGQDPHRNE